LKKSRFFLPKEPGNNCSTLKGPIQVFKCKAALHFASIPEILL